MEKLQLMSSLKQKGFSKKIIDAFKKIPRENFIPEELKDRAYEDTALPIGEGQTISTLSGFYIRRACGGLQRQIIQKGPEPLVAAGH